MANTRLDARITEAGKLMSQESPGPFAIIRKLLPYTTVAALLALTYMGWVFYYRWSQNRELQREADLKSVEQARKTYEMYGSGQLKILLFYATATVVPRGGSAELCYSVSNASTVKIDQGVEEIKPSLSHCVPIKPAHSTTYTLTAADVKGHNVTRSVNVMIR
jgi:hypothetical protein